MYSIFLNRRGGKKNDTRSLVHYCTYRKHGNGLLRHIVKTTNSYYYNRMPRSSLQTRKPKPNAVPIETKRARRKIVLDLCEKVKSAREKNPVQSGSENIIAKNMLIFPWLTRDMVHGALRRKKYKDKNYLMKLLLLRLII